MSPARRLAILLASCVATIVLTAPGPGPAGDAWERLRSMPPEERSRLADTLKAFESLSPAEQASVRELDRAIASEADENQANYYSVLRRFHLWHRRLTEEQRKALAALPPEQRMALVTRFLSEPRDSKRRDVFRDRIAEFAEFGAVSPYDLANLVKGWFTLTPQEQAEVSRTAEDSKKAEPQTRRVRVMSIARSRGFRPVERPTQEQLEASLDRVEKKFRPAALAKKENEKKQAGFKQHLAEYFYLIEHQPPRVSPEKLLQFNKALPPWLRTGLEDVPPDEARWMLTNLYRLIYRAPEEMPAAKPATATAQSSSSSPKAPPPPTPGAVPPKRAVPPAPPRPDGTARPF